MKNPAISSQQQSTLTLTSKPMEPSAIRRSQQEVIAIVRLYDCLLNTIAAMSATQQERLAIETKVNIQHLRFEGFDSKDVRLGHYDLLKTFVASGLYPDYKNHSLNTGSTKTLKGYRTMLSLYSVTDEPNTIEWERLVELIQIHARHSDNTLLTSKTVKY